MLFVQCWTMWLFSSVKSFQDFFSPDKIPVFITLQRSDEKSSKAVNQETGDSLIVYCVHAENPF